jgi:hypothetical protein
MYRFAAWFAFPWSWRRSFRKPGSGSGNKPIVANLIPSRLILPIFVFFSRQKREDFALPDSLSE